MATGVTALGDAVLADTASPPSTVTKNGNGTATLTRTNTYTGNLSVTAATVLLHNPNTYAGTTTIGNFWPYAPPLFGYIRAAMPWNEPRSLSDHEVYALTAYILAESKLIDPKLVLNAKTLAKVMMPNRNGFVARFPEITPH